MDNKKKKTTMFLESNGKCEYCGCDMVLSFAMAHTVKEVPLNLATLDHKYNRDHDQRNEFEREKRIFIVCWECNDGKSKIERNNQIVNCTEKTAKKISPKEMWTDEVFMKKVEELVDREKKLSNVNSEIDNEIKKLTNVKNKNCVQISKTVKYRNLIIEQRKLLQSDE